jgi:TonB family protein
MTAAIPRLLDSCTMPAPRFGSSQARLAGALILSAFVHLWLIAATTVDITGNMSSGVLVPMTVTIEPLAASSAEQEPLRPESESFGDTAVRQTQDGSAPKQNRIVDAVASAGSHIPPPAAENETQDLQAPVLPQMMDATYYSAHELDTYPVLRQPISLAQVARELREEAHGEVLMRLLIDEAGVVNEVSPARAHSADDFEELARTIIANARFLPARKDGRAVRSRVLIRVRIGTDVIYGAP